MLYVSYQAAHSELAAGETFGDAVFDFGAPASAEDIDALKAAITAKMRAEHPYVSDRSFSVRIIFWAPLASSAGRPLDREASLSAAENALRQFAAFGDYRYMEAALLDLRAAGEYAMAAEVGAIRFGEASEGALDALITRVALSRHADL